MDDDLIEFLRARLDEDEAVALATTQRQPYDEWDAVGAGTKDDAHRSHWEVVRIALPPPTPAAHDLAQHIARHDPARVLREVEAKRRVVDGLLAEGHAVLAPGGSTEIYCGADYGTGAPPCECGRDERVDGHLRLLALPYADHPDYRQEWRP